MEANARLAGIIQLSAMRENGDMLDRNGWLRRWIPRRAACPRVSGGTSSRASNRAWALLTSALVGALLACMVMGCTVRPAGIGESPGGYDAFLREVMAEAAKTPGAPKPAARATQRAGEWLGTGAGEGAGDAGASGALGGL